MMLSMYAFFLVVHGEPVAAKSTPVRAELHLGQRVVLKTATTKLRTRPDGATASQTFYSIDWKVVAREGAWLQLDQSIGDLVWVRENEVVSYMDSGTFAAKMLLTTPNDPWAWLILAHCYATNSRATLSLQAVEHAMQSRDLRSLALLTRGYAFGLEEEFDKAFVDINEVIRRDPGNPKAYAIRAKLYFMQGKYQAAREDCDRGEALAPRLRDWVITRGSSLSRERHHDKAIPELDKAIKLCPLSAGLFTERATCFYELHKHELAVADLNTAARLTPNDQQIYILRSRVWLAQRDYRRALQDYDTCLRLNPKHLLVMHWKALLLATCVDARVRNGREAVNTAQRMCELSEWCWPPFVSTLAAAHAELGDFQEARRLEHKAQELEEQPTFPYRSGSRRLQFYQQNKPLREGANPVTSLQPKMQLHLFGNKRDCPQFAQGYNISGN